MYQLIYIIIITISFVLTVYNLNNNIVSTPVPIIDKINSLYLINEIKMINLFPHSNIAKFEASGITLFNGVLYVIFDNLYGLGVVKNTSGKDNELFLNNDKNSQYEAITSDSSGRLFVLSEMGIVREMNNTGDIIDECKLDFKFSSQNKGFEGFFITDNYLIALCEGNHCQGGKKGKENGNGKLIVFVKNGKCWTYKNTWDIPPHVKFTDYSDITYFKPRLGKPSIAITSQEDGMLWIANVDIEKQMFLSRGTFYKFPNGYCNIEGITFDREGTTIYTVTDKAKSNQPQICKDKDQSLQVFSLIKT